VKMMMMKRKMINCSCGDGICESNLY
jgi:hypothetical protein